MKKSKKIAISLCVGLALFTPISPILANEKTNIEVSDKTDNINVMSTLNDEFEQNNTSVVKELLKLKKNYVKILENATTDQDKASLNSSINGIDSLINEYNNSSKLRTSHSTNVSAVVAYFGMHNYILAADLLVHMKVNKNKNSYYTPSDFYLTHVTQSSKFLQIRDSKKTYGKDVFENKGNGVDKDCYYAIHGFTFSKPSPTSRTVTIKDTYDYDSTKNYEGLAGVAINAMYKAQQDGYLTPYKISWTF